MTKRTKGELIENVEKIIRVNKNNKYCSVTQLMILIMEYLEKGKRGENQ